MKVHAVLDHQKIKYNCSREERASRVIYCTAVRRPLDIPSTWNVYGMVLCHAGLVAKTETGYYLIEYMNDNFVHATRANNYSVGNNFKFQGFVWIHDDPEPSFATTAVTLEELCMEMIKIMGGKKFNTFTHNCLNARYLTMKRFGMKSHDPMNWKRVIFLQGWYDLIQNDYRLESILKRPHLPRPVASSKELMQERVFVRKN